MSGNTLARFDNGAAAFLSRFRPVLVRVGVRLRVRIRVRGWVLPPYLDPIRAMQCVNTHSTFYRSLLTDCKKGSRGAEEKAELFSQSKCLQSTNRSGEGGQEHATYVTPDLSVGSVTTVKRRERKEGRSGKMKK